MTNLLEVHDLHAFYGKSHILQGVGLRVGQGEVLSLLGRNGSGRSTTLKALMGLVTPSRGSVRLAGQELAGCPPSRICRAGLAYVPEEREVFANLTVDENLRMGEQPPAPGAPRCCGASPGWPPRAFANGRIRLRAERGRADASGLLGQGCLVRSAQLGLLS